MGQAVPKLKFKLGCLKFDVGLFAAKNSVQVRLLKDEYVQVRPMYVEKNDIGKFCGGSLWYVQVRCSFI